MGRKTKRGAEEAGIGATGGPAGTRAARSSSAGMHAARDGPAEVDGQGDDPSSEVAGAEPVWLVRIVLVLFFAAFAVFLAREVRQVVEAGWRAWF